MAEGGKRTAGLKTREAILEAARHLFLRQGYHATGMREIARDAGVSLGAAYNHFSSKEEILEQILVERNLYGAMAEAISRARGDSVSELLQSGFQEIMGSLEGKGDYALLVFMDVLEFQGRHVARLAGESLPQLLGFFQRIDDLGHQRGEVRDVSPVLMARAYIGMIFSSFIIENIVSKIVPQDMRPPIYMDNWQQGTVDIMLHGILKDTPRGEVDG